LPEVFPEIYDPSWDICQLFMNLCLDKLEAINNVINDQLNRRIEDIIISICVVILTIHLLGNKLLNIGNDSVPANRDLMSGAKYKFLSSSGSK